MPTAHPPPPPPSTAGHPPTPPWGLHLHGASSQPAQAQPGTWVSPSTAQYLLHSILPEAATWARSRPGPVLIAAPRPVPPTRVLSFQTHQATAFPTHPTHQQVPDSCSGGGACSVVSPSANLLETTHILSRNMNEAICRVLGGPGPHIKDHRGTLTLCMR